MVLPLKNCMLFITKGNNTTASSFDFKTRRSEARTSSFVLYSRHIQAEELLAISKSKYTVGEKILTSDYIITTYFEELGNNEFYWDTVLRIIS